MERYENIPEEGTYPEGEDPLLQRVRQVAMGHFAVLGRVFQMEANKDARSYILGGEDAYGDRFMVKTMLDGACARQSLEGMMNASEYTREGGQGLRDLRWFIQRSLTGDDPAPDAWLYEGGVKVTVRQERNPEAWPPRRMLNRLLGRHMEKISYRRDYLIDNGISGHRYEAAATLEEALGYVVDTLNFLDNQWEQGLINTHDLTSYSSVMDFKEWRQ